MFAFENWHSALEMKLYLKRYIHHVGGLPDLRALRFTRYNQYESMILPMIRYLEGHGVRFHYNTKVTNIEFELTGGKKQARTICLLVDDEAERVDLTENDLVFITNGGCVESILHRLPGSACSVQPHPPARQRLGICGRRSPRRMRPLAAGEVLLRSGADQLDERHGHHAGRTHRALHPEHLPA